MRPQCFPCQQNEKQVRLKIYFFSIFNYILISKKKNITWKELDVLNYIF